MDELRDQYDVGLGAPDEDVRRAGRRLIASWISDAFSLEPAMMPSAGPSQERWRELVQQWRLIYPRMHDVTSQAPVDDTPDEGLTCALGACSRVFATFRDYLAHCRAAHPMR